MLHIRQRRLLGYVTRKHTFVNFAMVVKRVVWFFYLCSLLIVSLFELFFVHLAPFLPVYIFWLLFAINFFLPSRQVASTVKISQMETKIRVVSEFVLLWNSAKNELLFIADQLEKLSWCVFCVCVLLSLPWALESPTHANLSSECFPSITANMNICCLNLFFGQISWDVVRMRPTE